MIVFLLLPIISARILDQRDPKVDPFSLDAIVSKIIDSTMDDMRFRLRQAIYALTLRQTDVTPQSIDKYENWLLHEFLKQLRKQTTVVEEQNAEPSHTMSIALQTHTVDPLLTQRDNKLVTASDLRMLDSVDKPLVLSQASIPLWIILPAISCGILLIFIFFTLYCVRHQRKKLQVQLPRLPDPYTISAYNGPSAFLERLRETERDSESVWTQVQSVESISIQ